MESQRAYITDKGMAVLDSGTEGEHGWLLSQLQAAGSDGISIIVPGESTASRLGDLREFSNAKGLGLVTYDKRALAKVIKELDGIKYGNKEAFFDGVKESARYVTSKEGIKKNWKDFLDSQTEYRRY